MNVASIQYLGVPRRPRIRVESRSRVGSIAQGGRRDPALHTGAQRSLELEKQLFGVESKSWAKEIADELKELQSESEQKKHKDLSLRILSGFMREELDARIDGALGKSSHAGEKLQDPPAIEPILIRRVTVPPESSFLEEAVDKVPWVNRCLNLKALNIGTVPIRAMRRQKGDNPAEIDEDSPKARALLRLLERPNAHMSGTDLIEAISTWMNTRQALVWMMWDPKRAETTQEQAKGKLPNALYCLPAHRCVGMMWEGSLLYYRVTGAGGLSIPAWQIIRIGFYNPKEEFRCLSPLSAAFQCADTDYAMDLYNSNIFENGLKLSGLISFKNNISDEKRQSYENLMRQQVGVGNAHTILVLDNEANFQPMVSGTKDMDYKGLADSNKNKLTGEFGVPRAMLGDMEGSRSLASATIARRSFWSDTLVVELRKIVNKLNVGLVPYASDPDLYLEEDLSTIEALSEDRGEFATAFLAVSQALVQLESIEAVGQEDITSLLQGKFGVEVQGQTPEDTYEEDEEIMAEESVGVALIKRVKGLVLNRMSLDSTLFEAVPQDRVKRLAQKHGMKRALAKEFAAKLARCVAEFGDDKDKVAKYFDGLKVIAERNFAKPKKTAGN